MQPKITIDRPMVIVGANTFSTREGDDAFPYSYICAGDVKNLILIDGNNHVLHTPRPLIPTSIDLSLINAVVLPERIAKICRTHGLFYYSFLRDSGGNFFGTQEECEGRQKMFHKPELTTVKKSNKIFIDPEYIATLNPSFLQIDIEGHDLELLLNILGKGCRPDVIVYEYHYQASENVAAADQAITTLGYNRIEHPSNPKVNLVYAIQT